ncbi:uncharacterized protein LOC122717027 isoform X2 [Apis laboriosa]|uniref:uncharacterized protein LOC122717027 isoform X2 n=1 Tax=Apis laboriosa TaxID=183418 RepID=UPI001CC54838|nr:uncharacterized protein LOC122717027 isoform X2 [Apis laboriosa]
MKIIVILATAMCMGSVIAYPHSEEQIKSEALNRLMLIEADDKDALRSKRTIGILREVFPEISQDVNPETEDRANEVQQAAESQKNEVKVQFADEEGGADAVAPLTPLDEVGSEDDENRNKRFLSSLGGLSGSGSSGAGSGNFLFDILRQAADGAARAAGTVYRVVAGTQSLGLGLSASRDLGPVPQGAAPAAASSSTTAGSSTSAPAASGAGNLPPVVAGSGSRLDSSSGGESGEPDGVHEAVPGPVTRLFVIANRGIANLIQDLILRLAATSERIVNFKARLITSII